MWFYAPKNEVEIIPEFESLHVDKTFAMVIKRVSWLHHFPGLGDL